MFHYLRAFGRALAYPFRVAARRPLVTAALVFIGLAAAAAGAGVWYVHTQWQEARDALAKDRPKEALARLEICLTVWPNDPEVRLLAARAARLTGDLRGAEAHLNRCLKLSGGATEPVQLEFLLLRVQSGELEQVAGALVDSVEKGHPESPLILETLSRAYMHRLRHRSALACLSRWIEVQPDNPKPYHWRGWVLERLNNHKQATEDYHKALALDPELFRTRLRVAEMLLEAHQAPEALPHLERLHKKAPDDPEVQGRLGMCLYLLNRRDECRKFMEFAIARLPSDPAVLIHLAKLDLEQGRAADAERRLNKLLELDPADTEALHNLGLALQFQGRTAEATAALERHKRAKEQVERTNKLLREVADSPGATPADYAELGDLLLRIRRERLGVYWLERALERDPANARAHTAMAAHYEKLGEAERAAEHRRWLREPTAANPGPQSAGPKPPQQPQSP